MTSSQWLDIAVLAVAFIAAISGWRSGALGSLMSFVGVVLGAIAGVMLAPHIVSHVHSPRGQAVRRAVPDPGAGGDRRGRRRGARPCGARCHPQPRAAHGRLDHRRGAATGGRAGRRVAAGNPADVVRPAEPGRGGARLEGARRGRQVRPRMAASRCPSECRRCSSTSGLPDVLQPFGRTPIQAVDAPDAVAGRQPGRGQRPAQRGQDPRCGTGLPEGAWREPVSSSRPTG